MNIKDNIFQQDNKNSQQNEGKKITIKKSDLFKIVIGAWIIFSLSYIGFDIWGDFKVNYANQAYQKGKEETVNQLIKKADNPQCDPFTVYNGDNKRTLINTNCLRQPSKTEE